MLIGREWLSRTGVLFEYTRKRQGWHGIALDGTGSMSWVRSMSSVQMEAQRVKSVDGGKLVIPAAMRRELGISTGDTVLVDVDDGELRVRSVSRALERARAILRKYVPEGVSVADELIADRRREAERE